MSEDETLPVDRNLADLRVGSRSSGARWVVTLGAVALVSLVGWLLWSLWQPPVLGTALLPDGTRVILRGATYGTHHEFSVVGPLPAWLSKLGLPLSPPQPKVVDLPVARSVAWFDVIPPRAVAAAASAAAAAGSPLVISTSAVAFVHPADAHGCTYPGTALIVDRGSAAYEELQWLELPEETAEGNAWTLRGVAVSAESERLFEFLVRSPARNLPPRTPAALAPGPLPQTQRTGRVEAVLESLQHGEDANADKSAVLIRAHGRGRPSGRWTSMFVWAEDRWGITGAENPSNLPAVDTPEGFPFPTLCRGEPAWKVTALLAPDPRSTEPPDYSWEPVSLPVFPLGAPPGEARQTRTSNGVRLVIVGGAAGTMREAFGDQPRSWGVMLDVSVERARMPVRVAVTRVNGEPLAALQRRAGQPPGSGLEDPGYVDLAPRNGWRGSLSFANPSGESKLKVELVGYQGGEKVEFVVKP